MNNKAKFNFPHSDIEKIRIENWTSEPVEDIIWYITNSMKVKKSAYDSNKILILNFEKYMVQYEKKKNFDKWIIYKNN